MEHCSNILHMYQYSIRNAMEKQTHNVKEPGKAKGLMHMIEYAQEPHVVTESKYKPKG